MKKTIVILALLAVASVARAQTVTVNWTEVHQQIDGFGASDAFCINQAGIDTCNLTDAQADLFFSTQSGVGLSLLRAAVPNDGSCAGTCSIPGIVNMKK